MKISTVQEAWRIVDELRRTGEARGYSWAFDTVRWLLRDETPEGMVLKCDGHNTPDANYRFVQKSW